jgi:HEAT repeat protein
VLGRIGRSTDTQLVGCLLKDPSPDVRREAVQALARLEHGEASEPLRLALADESPTVRIAAARALGAAEDPKALGDLQRLADDDDARVRAAAMRAVGAQAARAELPDASRAEASALLETALNDEGPVALAAVEALRGVGGPSSARAARRLLLRDDPELVQAAVACVGAHGDRECVEELIPLMAHPHWAVRSEAIGTLAERRVVQAVPAILRRLETEQDDFVRDAILRALRRLES